MYFSLQNSNKKAKYYLLVSKKLFVSCYRPDYMILFGSHKHMYLVKLNQRKKYSFKVMIITIYDNSEFVLWQSFLVCMNS